MDKEDSFCELLAEFNLIISRNLESSWDNGEDEFEEKNESERPCKKIKLDEMKAKKQSFDQHIFSEIKSYWSSILEADKNNENYAKNLKLLMDLLANVDMQTGHKDTIAKVLSESGQCPPLDALWLLSKKRILSLEYLYVRINNGKLFEDLLRKTVNIILHGDEMKNSFEITSMMITSFVSMAYDIDDHLQLKDSCKELLNSLIKIILNSISQPPQDIIPFVSDSKEKNYDKKTINIYEQLIQCGSIDEKTVQRFLSDQLLIILTHSPEVPLNLVIQRLHCWKSVSSNQNLCNYFYTFIKCMGADKVIGILNGVVSKLEVNWGSILTLIGCLLTTSNEAVKKTKCLIESYLKKGCEFQENEYLILGLIFARHSSQEGRHVFPAYRQWFMSMFGSENNSPCNTKLTFNFFMDFLSELVPHEKIETLRDQISEVIFIPKGCQQKYKDYCSLAKAQINALDLSVHQKSSKSDTDVVTVSEVQAAIQYFEEHQKAPASVMEASIFHRQYFVNSFLPVLLKPRIIPSDEDGTSKLIEYLVKAQKISQGTYKKYIASCNMMKQTDGLCAMEISVNHKASEFPELDSLLSSVINKCHDESQVLSIFSQIANCLEKLLGTETSTSFIMCKPVNKNSQSFKVILKVISTVDGIFEDSDTFMRQLVGHLVSSTSNSVQLQEAFLSYLMLSISTGNLDQTKLIGILCCEIDSLKGLFLPVRSNNSDESWPVYLLNTLENNGSERLEFCCFVLYWWIKWTKLGVSLEAEALYCCLATRLAITKKLNDDNNEISVQMYDVNFPMDCEGTVLLCCKLLCKSFNSLHKPTLQQWTKFELCTKWYLIRRDIQLYYLNFWLTEYFLKSNMPAENLFSQMFSTLINEGLQKENFPLLFIVLQTFKEQHDENSLLNEWLKFRENRLDASSPNLNKSLIYQNKLSSYLSLILCFPARLFLSKNKVLHQADIFNSFVKEVLVVSSGVFLDLNVTRYLMEAVHCVCIASNEFQTFYAQIRQSIIFHWTSLQPVVQRYQKTWEEVSFLRCFQSSYDKSLNTGNIIGIKTLSSLIHTGRCSPVSTKVDELTDVILHLFYYIGSIQINHYQGSTTRLNKCLNILSSTLNKYYEKGYGYRLFYQLNRDIPVWEKSILIGSVYSGLHLLSKGQFNQRNWLLSFCIESMNRLCKLIETTDDDIENLSYIAKMNYQLLNEIQKSSKSDLSQIDPQCLVNADDELVGTIKFSIKSK